jgi:hypothetical protein
MCKKMFCPFTLSLTTVLNDWSVFFSEPFLYPILIFLSLNFKLLFFPFSLLSAHCAQLIIQGSQEPTLIITLKIIVFLFTPTLCPLCATLEMSNILLLIRHAKNLNKTFKIIVFHFSPLSAHCAPPF